MKVLCIAVYMLLNVALLFAQPDTILLEDVFISVAPFEQRLSEASGSLSIIQPSDIESGFSINLADQLNTAPGVHMAAGTYASNRISIRGIGSRTPYSTNRIRAYLDDIPLTGGDGISSLEEMDLLAISRIEVLKGPASALYGSGLGGSILLKTARPGNAGFSYKVNASMASFNTKKYGISTAWKKENIELLAGYSRASSEGFRENNEYRRDQLYFFGKSETKKSLFTLNLIATDLEAQIPSSLSEYDFLHFPEKAAANWLAVNGYKANKKVIAGTGWKYNINNTWQNKLVLFTTLQNPVESRPFNILDDQSSQFGVRNFMQYSKASMKIQSGIELFSETYVWKIFETLGGVRGNLQLHNQEVRRYGNAFTHAIWKPSSKLVFEAGVNINLLEYEILTRYQTDNNDQSGKYSYKPLVSPRVGMSYSFLPLHTFRFSAGQGFSAPSVEEALLPDGLVNSDLKPETGWNFDIGFRGQCMEKRFFYDLSVYSIYIRNMLVTKRIAEDVFTGINAGLARLSGIEFYSKLLLNPLSEAGNWQTNLHLSLFLNSNRFTTFVDDGSDYSGNNLPAIPAQMLNFRVSSRYKKILELQAEFNYSGKQFLNDANSGIYNGHALTNCRATYKFQSESKTLSFKFSAGVNNVLNSHYASMILVNAPSFGGADPRYYYPGMPRTIFASLIVEEKNN